MNPGEDDNHRLMGYCRIEDTLPLIECRQKSQLPENPETVIVCLFPYFVGEYPERNVARYAIVNDYHKVAGDILASLAAQLKSAFPGEKFAAFVDNSPVREVRAAYAAGLGAIGMNGMLIHETFGSRVFIGTVITTLKLRYENKPAKTCLNCGLCIEACPTGAISKTAPLKRELCRSAISQLKREPSDFERGEIRAGGLAWGCDICADACPLNKSLPKSPVKGFYEDILPVLTLQNLDDALLKKPYNWRGKDVLLRNLSIIAPTPSEQ